MCAERLEVLEQRLHAFLISNEKLSQDSLSVVASYEKPCKEATEVILPVEGFLLQSRLRKEQVNGRVPIIPFWKP